MKRFDWSEQKNEWLKRVRKISFEIIRVAVEDGRVLDDIEHPNKQLYPNQRIMVVKVEGYVYYVPYVEDEEKIFLKTIFPSRKATKKYLPGGDKK